MIGTYRASFQNTSLGEILSRKVGTTIHEFVAERPKNEFLTIFVRYLNNNAECKNKHIEKLLN